MKKLVITDNEYLYLNFKKILSKKKMDNIFDFRFSFNNKDLNAKYTNSNFVGIKIKNSVEEIIKNYDLVISLHCKQIFPKELVEKVRCINIHPGYNPENRGWFPQVFSILNGKQAGATIHLIDDMLDHGDILFREKVDINEWETSKDVYDKVLNIELKMLDEKLEEILSNSVTSRKPEKEGNVNYFVDFKNLCEIDLEEKVTFKEAIDKLRALTHGDYKNAYFFDSNGNKVFVGIKLEKESQ